MKDRQALTNAERQRAYRLKQKQLSGRRIDYRVDISTYNMLEHLALYGNETRKDVIVRLIEAEYKKQLNDKNGKFYNFIQDMLHGNADN